MKIRIKTLQNKTYNLHIDPKDTISQIKQKIDDQLHLGSPESQKLIHKGDILKDWQTAQLAGIKEKSALILIVGRKKFKSKPKKNSAPQNPEDNLSQETIANLMGMGFTKEQVVKALRAANNNSDRAVEYLLCVRSSFFVFIFQFDGIVFF